MGAGVGKVRASEHLLIQELVGKSTCAQQQCGCIIKLEDVCMVPLLNAWPARLAIQLAFSALLILLLLLTPLCRAISTFCAGKCWYIHNLIKYEFDFQVSVLQQGLHKKTAAQSSPVTPLHTVSDPFPFLGLPYFACVLICLAVFKALRLSLSPCCHAVVLR